MSRKKRNRTPKVLHAIPVEPTEVEQPPPQGTTHPFWNGEFGNQYTQRNRVDWAARKPFWEHIVQTTYARRFLDVGCNAGWNMLAIRSVLTDMGVPAEEIFISGVDVNLAALTEAGLQGFDARNLPAHRISEPEPEGFGHGVADIVVTSGVLIHIPPDELRVCMEAIANVSAQYVLAIEYDAAQETEVEYRGHAGRLWKRPFGRLYQELGLSLVEFGESAEGFDSCAWWLLEKQA